MAFALVSALSVLSGRPAMAVPTRVSTTVPVGPSPLPIGVQARPPLHRATVTDLTVSTRVLVAGSGNISTYFQKWKASVLGKVGLSPTLTAGAVTFKLTDGTNILATFSGTGTNPVVCTFDETVTATQETVRSTAPHPCSGGTGGTVTLTPVEVQSPTIFVQAFYAGGPGWAPSCSGPVNPETVSPGSPKLSGHSPTSCR